jgi:hypothetical protein
VSADVSKGFDFGRFALPATTGGLRLRRPAAASLGTATTVPERLLRDADQRP